MYSNYSEITSNTIKNKLTKSFAWMFMGLLITGIVGTISYASGFLFVLMSIPYAYLGIIFVPIILCLFFGKAMCSSSSTAIKVMFILYAFSMGFSMASLGLAYDLGVIGIAFGISSFYFLCLVLIGITTKRDLSKVGTLCMVGLFAILISQIFLALFHVAYDVRMYSILGLLIFTGLTAWDVQNMNRVLTYSNGQSVEQEKMSIYFALQLYLDFINIFLYILRLVGSKNN